MKMNLTDQQKELLIDLIDGYFYPRDLINDYEKFLEIRKILDPNDRWIDNFQHGYFEHPDLVIHYQLHESDFLSNLIQVCCTSCYKMSSSCFIVFFPNITELAYYLFW